LSKYRECFRNASVGKAPFSRSALTVSTRSCMAESAWPRPMISKACTSETPAAIMVANWRLKTTISALRILRLIPPSQGGGFFSIRMGLIP